jgi:hypothetical protein
VPSTQKRLEGIQKMADKNTTLFYVKAFEMQLSLVPGFPALKKMYRDLNVSLPKKVKDAIGSETKAEELKVWQTQNKFADALDQVKKWIAESVNLLENAEDDLFESKRGRDVSNIEVTLFGSTAPIQDHVAILIAGSKLGELTAGMVDTKEWNENEWKSLHSVLSAIKSQAIDSIVPAEFKPKRGKKDAENAPTENPETDDVEAETETEETEETTE